MPSRPLPLDAPLAKMVSFRQVQLLDKPDKALKIERPRRIIKRYSNRKLYDTKDSRYVTLLQIAEMIRANEDVQIIDNATKEDKTDVTLALINSEELKARPRGIPLATLKALIRQRSEKILTHLRDGPIRRLISKDHPEEAGDAGEAAQVPEEDDLTGSE